MLGRHGNAHGGGGGGGCARLRLGLPISPSLSHLVHEAVEDADDVGADVSAIRPVGRHAVDAPQHVHLAATELGDLSVAALDGPQLAVAVATRAVGARDELSHARHLLVIVVGEGVERPRVGAVRVGGVRVVPTLVMEYLERHLHALVAEALRAHDVHVRVGARPVGVRAGLAEQAAHGAAVGGALRDRLVLAKPSGGAGGGEVRTELVLQLHVLRALRAVLIALPVGEHREKLHGRCPRARVESRESRVESRTTLSSVQSIATWAREGWGRGRARGRGRGRGGGRR